MPSWILQWAIQLGAFDFDIVYVKGNSISPVGTLSRLQFIPKQSDISNDIEDKYLYLIWRDLLAMDCFTMGILYDLISIMNLECKCTINNLSFIINMTCNDNRNVTYTPHSCEGLYSAYIIIEATCQSFSVKTQDTLQKKKIQKFHATSSKCKKWWQHKLV